MSIEQSKLYIKKRSFSEILVFLIFIIPLVTQVFIDIFKPATVITFVIDASLVVFVIIMMSKKVLTFNRQLTAFSGLIILFLVYTLISYLFNLQSPFYYFWGVRNYFRFYVAFFVFALVLNKNKAETYLKILDLLFWVNALVCVVQILMGYRQDFLGGLFGVEYGCNGALLVFLIVVIAKSLLQFMNGVETITLCLMKSGVALIIAAFAELKVFYFVFIVLVVISTVITSFSWKKVTFLLVSGLLISISSTILVLMFDNFSGFLSLEGLIMQLTLENYASKNDIGRFSAFSSISERFLPAVSDQLFGMGLGNCDTSAIPLFNTDFYDSHSATHYAIFSHSFLFIETGIIGVIIYCSFFIICLVKAIQRLRLSDKNDKLFSQLAIVMSLMCFVLFVYNLSLRVEIGYLIYFVLALPFVDVEEKFHIELQR